MSPVADTYGKKGLVPVAHRVEMCRLAAADTDNVMVDVWEAAQPDYTRTLQVGQQVNTLGQRGNTVGCARDAAAGPLMCQSVHHQAPQLFSLFEELCLFCGNVSFPCELEPLKRHCSATAKVQVISPSG